MSSRPCNDAAGQAGGLGCMPINQSILAFIRQFLYQVESFAAIAPPVRGRPSGRSMDIQASQSHDAPQLTPLLYIQCTDQLMVAVVLWFVGLCTPRHFDWP